MSRTMNSRERAERILALCQLPTSYSAYVDPRNGLPIDLLDRVAGEVEEYGKETIENHNVAGKYFSQAYEDGRTSAFEEAVKIVEERVSRGATDSFRVEPNFRAMMKQQPEIAVRKLQDSIMRSLAEAIRLRAKEKASE